MLIKRFLLLLLFAILLMPASTFADPHYNNPSLGTVTLTIEPDSNNIMVGDVINVTLNPFRAGCPFSYYEMSLHQAEPHAFEFVSPTSHVARHNGQRTFTLKAVKAGSTKLSGGFYGESFCEGEGYRWTGFSGEPVTISVREAPSAVNLKTANTSTSNSIVVIVSFVILLFSTLLVYHGDWLD